MCNVMSSYACVLYGSCFCAGPRLLSYPLSVRRHFAVCSNVSLTDWGVPRVNKVAERCTKGNFKMELQEMGYMDGIHLAEAVVRLLPTQFESLAPRRRRKIS